MKRKSNCFVTILFLIYLALLVWIILFKLQFSISDLDKVRSINFIPFHYDKEIGAAFHLTEVQLWKKIFLSGQKMNWFRLK